MRFLDVADGTVRLVGAAADGTAEGVDVRTLAGDDVRRALALCGQDPHVFDSTLEANLRVARRDATAVELADAVRRAGLGDWVDTLPRGFATPVGESGTALSGGQLRRLALARALLSEARILVLDEPTEHLDVETADALTHDILDAADGRAVLLVTHRLTGLERVDEIVVLDRGRVVERGTHASLVAAGGPYARRWRLESAADGAPARPGPRAAVCAG
jgi:ABC-type multidrug transport system fused ATPase/permease subunit